MSFAGVFASYLRPHPPVRQGTIRIVKVDEEWERAVFAHLMGKRESGGRDGEEAR